MQQSHFSEKVLVRQFLNLPRPVNLPAALEVHQNAFPQMFDGFSGVLFFHWITGLHLAALNYTG
ncbi:hypothetical protein OAI91_00080 [bacterium]|nr:hypothetical protein [bacterium]